MKTVLLAEHHAPTLEHLRTQLSQTGFTVRAASDPGRALELFVSERPDVVVLAVDFPRLDGKHLGNLIRSSDHGSRVPMIAIDKGHLGKAKGVGAILDLKANAYLADPLKPNELVAKLGQLVTAHAQVRAAITGVRATLSRSPIVAGELKGFPLPALLHSFHRVRRDGLLVVAFRDLTRRVFFLKGTPVHYDSTARQDTLPGYLVERGTLTEEQAEKVHRALAGGARVAAALAEAGVPLAGEELLQVLREYNREKIAQLIGMRDGRYAFYAGAEFAEEIPPIDVPALAPILDGARRSFPLKLFAQPLKLHLSSFPHRTSEFGKDLPALGLTTSDLKVAMQMNGRIPLRELLAHGRGDLRLAYGLVWFLSLTGHVKFSPTPLAASDATGYGADVIAPRRKKPLPAEIVGQLREAAVKIITSSYFRGLGLDITADTEAVERAYHQVAAKFHPDTYSEYDTSEIQDLLESVQDKLAASYRVLSVEEKRKGYLQYLLSRLDVGRMAEVNVDAEIALKRGETALRRKDVSGAMAEFERAIALNPREPEYYCYLAWASFQAVASSKKERGKAAQKLLKKALALNPYLERANVISAIIEGEVGDAGAARKRLLKVLEMNPRSQLAKAALRRIGR